MAPENALSPAELLARLSSIASSHGGASVTTTASTIAGTLTAIKAKWILGGRKITSNFSCALDPATREAHFRESAVESSWGLPPPTFTVETTSQYGTRVNATRTDKGVGGGGVLEFGKFREGFERVVEEAGWKFVYDIA